MDAAQADDDPVKVVVKKTYHMGKTAGAGTFGTVRKGRCLTTQRPCAIKLLLCMGYVGENEEPGSSYSVGQAAQPRRGRHIQTAAGHPGHKHIRTSARQAICNRTGTTWPGSTFIL